MKETTPVIGEGRFQWNAGGWFGGLGGGIAYLVFGGVLFLPRNGLLAAIWLVSFSIVLSMGLFLWSRRETLAPYRAIQWLMLTSSICGTVAIIAANLLAPKLLSLVRLTPTTSLLMLLCFPAMMIGLHLLDIGARENNGSAS